MKADAAVPSSPRVMLSPNAANLVRPMLGGRVTVTAKVHEADRCRPSVAVQVTVVEPIGKTV
jgi:hypothetical protein